MGDDPKGPPKPTKARFALAANLKELMSRHQHGWLVGITAAQLEEGCGVSAKTIRRILDPYSDISPNLDTLDALAAIFKVETGDLLKPQRLQPQVQGKERQKNPSPRQVGAPQQGERVKKG
jgi:transcriptional regulator with XRE-family HTH domain